MESIKPIVEEVMVKHPMTRGCDTLLIFKVLQELGFKVYIDFDKISEMPSLESITRLRRHIQHDEHRLLPDNEEVERFRRIKQEAFRMKNSQYNY